MMIIHETSKRSATMPKRGEKKVLVNGICTCPPSASTAKKRSASSAVSTASDNEKPLKLEPFSQRPSDARMIVSPILSASVWPASSYFLPAGVRSGVFRRFLQEQTTLPKLIRTSQAQVLTPPAILPFGTRPSPRHPSRNSLYTSTDFLRGCTCPPRLRHVGRHHDQRPGWPGDP